MTKTTPTVAEQPTGRTSINCRPVLSISTDYGLPVPANAMQPTQSTRRTNHRVQPIRDRLTSLASPSSLRNIDWVHSSIQEVRSPLPAPALPKSITSLWVKWSQSRKWRGYRHRRQGCRIFVRRWSSGRTEVFNIYMSPDIRELIVSLDWLRRQGRIEWDFTDDRIQLDNGGWLKLHDDAKSRCRRSMPK